MQPLAAARCSSFTAQRERALIKGFVALVPAADDEVPLAEVPDGPGYGGG